MTEPTIEYTDNPNPVLDQDGYGLLGHYIVTYADGWTVIVPHAGWVGTISAEPLDPGIDEQRQIIITRADQGQKP